MERKQLDSAIDAAAQFGLYDSSREHDACGVGFVANIKGKASHALIQQALLILQNLDHRGAVGADPLCGDGAGILVQIPDAFYREELSAQGVVLPPPGEYGVGMIFLPREHGSRLACEQELERTVRAEGQTVLGMARCPGRSRHAHVAARAGSRTGDSPDLHRPRCGRHGPRRARAQALHHPQARQPQHPGAQAAARQGVLRAVDLDAHGGLQGAAARRPGRPLLPRPRRSARRQRDRPRAPALFDQHLPVVGARPSVPHGRAQRRDQHGQGQLQLDARPRGRDVVAGPGRGPEEALAADLRRTVRHRLLRQLPRTADHGGLFAAARHDDDDPGSVGTAHADGRFAPRLLRVPRGDDGAVGRPGRDRLHRRRAHRRDAGSQRPASGALHRHRRRSGRDGIRDGRPADRRQPHRQEVAPAARQDVPDRHRAGPHHRRCRAQDAARRQQAVQGVDQAHPHPSRRSGDAGQDRLGGAPRCRAARSPAGVRLYAGGRPPADGTDGPRRRGSHRLDGQRRRRCRCCRTAARSSTTTSSNCSRR